MKKKQIETLEKINEERKLNKETKEKIAKKALRNFLFATGILLLFVVLKLIAINLKKQVASLIFKEISIGLFVVTLFLFETAYKKDDDNLAITSIEMFFLSIVTLLTPYILISRTSIYTSIVGVYFVVYYAIKNLILYRNQKNEYLNQKSDIAEIVKRESQDKLAQEQLEKIKLENKQEQEKEEKPVKRGRGRPRKTTSEATKNTEKTTKTANTTGKKSTKSTKTTTKKTAEATKTTAKNTTKTTEKVEEKETQEPPKRKRGRPRKINN